MAEKKPKFDIVYTYYTYKGVDSNGSPKKGAIRSDNIDRARSQLEAQGITVELIKKRNALLIPKNAQKKIKKTDISLLFRQLTTMLDAGIPLVQALEFMANGVESLELTNLIMSLHHCVSSGKTFAEALARYPKYFDSLSVSLVNVGEQSGTLEKILDRIASYLERMELLRSRIKKAMFYPTMMLVVMAALATLLLGFVVPTFEGMFKSFGKELPMPTRVVIAMSNFIVGYWWLILLIIAAVIVSYKLAKKRSIKFQYFIARLSIKMPIFGELMRKSAIARIVSTLSITLAAGIPLVEALDTVGKAAGNLLYTDAISVVREEVKHGGEFNKALSKSDLFPIMVTQMIGIGEKSGALETMLTKIAEFYNEEVNSMVDAISTLIEPIMIVLLGIIVGGFVISMYLPIFKIGELV